MRIQKELKVGYKNNFLFKYEKILNIRKKEMRGWLF